MSYFLMNCSMIFERRIIITSSSLSVVRHLPVVSGVLDLFCLFVAVVCCSTWGCVTSVSSSLVGI